MNEKQMNAETKEYPYYVTVRFRNSSRSYSFGTDRSDIQSDEWLVVETSQGVELGQCQLGSTVTTAQQLSRGPLKPVLRKASKEDLERYEDNLEAAKRAFDLCEKEIAELGLGMRLLSAEYMLDRSKILFIYRADQRVDFRELLKRLGSHMRCRIELRQIGDRDKAKMVGGLGMCGMECCCARFKTHMDVISINMAKTQLLALNTEKLSGSCGKLMCCLKYENDNYKELTEGLPKMGAHVEYEGEMYRVTSMNVMSQEAHLENSEKFLVITIEDLKNKAVVRKGVTIARKQPGKRQVKEQQAPGVPRTQRVAEFRANDSEKNRGISAESKIVTHSELKPERKRKPVSVGDHSGLRPQNGTRSANNSNRNRNQNRRRPETSANNPNVTVRSFKSSRTRAKEAGQEESK